MALALAFLRLGLVLHQSRSRATAFWFMSKQLFQHRHLPKNWQELSGRPGIDGSAFRKMLAAARAFGGPLFDAGSTRFQSGILNA